MAQYASLDEAFGGTWGKQKKPQPSVPKEQDTHSNQKVYNSPTRRTEAALSTHSKVVQDTLRSLPIGDEDSNYAPATYPGKKKNNSIEPFTNNGVDSYVSPPIPGTGDWSYASTPPAFNQSLHFEAKIDKLMRMVEGAAGTETPSTHDLLLYIFTGVFALFVLDSFVHLGSIRR